MDLRNKLESGTDTMMLPVCLKLMISNVKSQTAQNEII